MQSLTLKKIVHKVTTLLPKAKEDNYKSYLTILPRLQGFRHFVHRCRLHAHNQTHCFHRFYAFGIITISFLYFSWQTGCKCVINLERGNVPFSGTGEVVIAFTLLSSVSDLQRQKLNDSVWMLRCPAIIPLFAIAKKGNLSTRCRRLNLRRDVRVYQSSMNSRSATLKSVWN
jgi:hypothetical protein